jgi:hypothetical protein
MLEDEADVRQGNGIGTEGADGAASGERIENVHRDLAIETTLDASASALHGTRVTITEPGSGEVGGSFVPAAIFVALTLGLVAATAACLAVVGLALALWLPALIVAFAEEALRARGPLLAAGLAAPLAVTWLLDRSWNAFANARTARCAEYMLVALGGALALYAFLVDPPVPWRAEKAPQTTTRVE